MSMTDFVLQVVQTPNINEAICWEQTQQRLDKIYQYSLFLKQPLKLEMFVPCDEYGNVLEEPSVSEFDNFDLNEGGQVVDYERYNNACDEYEKAKEQVLFEGFEIVNTRAKGRVEVRLIGANVSGSSDTIQNDFAGLYFYDSRNEKSRLHAIEGLLNFHPLKLTPNAIKQIQP